MPNVKPIPGTAVFVHGLPETSRVWDSLRRVVERDSIALALPGFGAPRPPGFSATKDAYAEWLADVLNGIEGPIDLAPAQALTAPTRSPRAIRRSSAIASAITGRIMIMISTDMYHHCGPRVAF